MGMAYNDAKSFECDQHIVTLMERILTDIA